MLIVLLKNSFFIFERHCSSISNCLFIILDTVIKTIINIPENIFFLKYVYENVQNRYVCTMFKLDNITHHTLYILVTSAIQRNFEIM